MKNPIIVLLLATTFIFSCKGTPENNNSAESGTFETVSLEFKIEGMTCNGCEQTIENAVKNLAGIESVNASHIDGNAIVLVDVTKLDTTLIKNKIDEVGYSALTVIMPEKE